MKQITWMALSLVSLLGISLQAFSQAPEKAPCIPCEDLKKLELPEVTIHDAVSVKAGEAHGNRPAEDVPICKVIGTIGAEINFEVLLPMKWNGRFAMGGGGGFVGSVSNVIHKSVSAGFATSGTDTGHRGGSTAKWGLNNMERQLNFGHMAIHRTAVVSKSIIKHFYCAPIEYSYFLGASRGGGQAMMEAQRYPEDFDGIVAGCPAFNWTGFTGGMVNNAKALYPKNLKEPVLTKDNLKLLEKMLVDNCDGLDGVRDSILNDPRECHFDIATIPRCPNGVSGPNCFTEEQYKALKAIYGGLTVQGKKIHQGFPFGGENDRGGWSAWIVSEKNSGTYNSQHAFYGIETAKYLIFNDENWDYLSYSLDNYLKDSQYAAAYLNATSTDYSAFIKRGGKMIIWQGWADPALSALNIIQHYEDTEQANPQIRDNVRLFLLPGVLHGGGKGPDNANWLELITAWVEHKKVPDQIVVSKKTAAGTSMRRPVYPYPIKAKYDGKGDPNKETSFSPQPK
jgi:hypothetical protein